MSIQRIIEIPLEEVQTEFAKNKNTCKESECLICGKEIKKYSNYNQVQLLTNGNIVSTDEDLENSQGLFKVGLECRKKLVIKFYF